jgi:hypothetical protein
MIIVILTVTTISLIIILIIRVVCSALFSSSFDVSSSFYLSVAMNHL